MEQEIKFKVVINWNSDEIELDKSWFENYLKNYIFQKCDEAEVELHILPIK